MRARAGDLDLGASVPSEPAAPSQPGAALGLDDQLFGAAPVVQAPPPLPQLLSAEQGRGLTIRGQLSNKDGSGIVYQLAFENSAAVALDGFMIQFNKNLHGLVPTSQVVPVSPIAPGATVTAQVPVSQSPSMVASGFSASVLQVGKQVTVSCLLVWRVHVEAMPLYISAGGHQMHAARCILHHGQNSGGLVVSHKRGVHAMPSQSVCCTVLYCDIQQNKASVTRLRWL